VIVDAVSLAILQLVDPPLASGVPLQRIAAAALLNTAIGAIVILPARIVLGRVGAGEKAAW
jgi:hypothetical protein